MRIRHILLLAAALSPPPAFALFSDDDARKGVADLQKRVEAQQQQLQRIEREVTDKRAVIELSNLIDGLRQDIANLRGQIEVLSNRIDGLDKRQKDLYVDLDTRLRKFEQGQVDKDKAAQAAAAEQQAYEAGLAQFKANNYGTAIQSLQSFLATYPQSPLAPSAQYWIGNAHYALRDYRSAAAAFDKLAAQGALTADDLTLLATSQMQLRDFGKATTTLERAIAANEKAGRSKQNAKLLEMLYSAYHESKNDAKRMQTLYRWVAAAPSTSNFKYLANSNEIASSRDPVVMINTYRLGSAKGILSGEHYVKYAETALDLSSPGEAVAMLEKGMAAGAIKKDDRNNKVLADAKSQVERVKATLPQQEAEAKAIRTGEPEAKLTTANFTLKNYAKASEAAQRAVTKGNLKRADDVNMMLGISLANSKKPAEAKKAFAAAAAANAKTRGIADLWASVTG